MQEIKNNFLIQYSYLTICNDDRKLIHIDYISCNEMNPCLHKFGKYGKNT